MSTNLGNTFTKLNGPWDIAGNTHANFATNNNLLIAATDNGIYTIPLQSFLPANWSGNFGYFSDSNSITIWGFNGSYSTVTIPSTIGSLPVTSIGDNAFANQSGITSLTIPNTVTNLGNSVFAGCSNLTSITIPDSVVSFGTNLFGKTPNVAVNASQSMISYLAQNASALGLSGTALTSLQNESTAIGVFGWLKSWLPADNAFLEAVSTALQLPSIHSSISNSIAALNTSVSSIAAQTAPTNPSFITAIATNLAFQSSIGTNQAFLSALAVQVSSNPALANLMPKFTQTLSFAAFKPITLSTNIQTITLKATSSAKLTNIIFASGNDAVATVSNNLLTIAGVGTTTITASSVGSSNFAPASAVQNLVVNQAAQTIKFSAIPAQTYSTLKSVTLGASASSGLPVTYSVANTGVAIVSNNVLLLQGTGSTTVTATQAGNSVYLPVSATQPLIVK